MGKLVDDTVLDGALNVIKNNTTQVCVCATQPTNYTEATSTFMLAKYTAWTSGNFTGPANGDTNGRELQRQGVGHGRCLQRSGRDSGCVRAGVRRQ